MATLEVDHIPEDDRCSYCGSTGWNWINGHYCHACEAGPELAKLEEPTQ